MRNTLKDCLRKVKQNKKYRVRGVTVLAILSVVVSINVFMGLRRTGLTLAGEAMCGLEDHTHTEDCYEMRLCCGYSTEIDSDNADNAGEGETTDSIDSIESLESLDSEAAPHIHTEACYEKKLCCSLREHVHTLDCYADSTADVESQLDWQAMFGGTLTGDLRTDLVAVARSQIGYTESERNFRVDDMGGRSGYTRYGAWYGAPYEDWSAMFVSFCLHYAGSESSETPYNIGASSMLALWRDLDRYAAAGDYTPDAGDLIFFADNTVGIVSSVYYDLLTVVRGDVEGAVVEQTVMTYESAILGYGILVAPESNDLSFPGMFSSTASTDAAPSDAAPSDAASTGTTSSETASTDATSSDTTPSDITSSDTPSTDTASTDTPSTDAPSSESTSSDAASAGTTLVFAACSCNNSTKPAISHGDGCAYKSQLQTLATEKSAEELYALWDALPTDAREYILLYLSWNDQTKFTALKALIGESTDSLTATLGNLQVKIEGDLPATASLALTDPQYSENTILSFINPNLHGSVNWTAVYDIAITDNGAPYTPTSPVTVTVTIPDLIFDANNEFFAVAHLNANTGEMIDSTYVEVVDKSVTFTATGFSPYLFYTVDKEVEGGERILGTNWIALRDSGWFHYWEQFLTRTTDLTSKLALSTSAQNGDDPSDVQIDNVGGESSKDAGVVVSKTIDGTDIENVFDITLTVQTQQSITEIYNEPDMAVVIVMDISNTMKENFGDTTRYKAAMEAAEAFIDQFAANTGKVSQIGYVAFNTDAHQIFNLSNCSNQTDVNTLKNTMRQKTGNIINDDLYQDGYGASHSRFTNIEAGLKMGYDMLKGASNENKYLILLTDGFPTTYISSGYNGYDPYTPSGTPGNDGVFYDNVVKTHCNYGTNYSDKAAIRARQMATKIKNAGVKIFSIGVDVGGQTIDGYERRNENGTSKTEFSTIDRISKTYEIGNANSSESYKNWLQNSIGSGYYYDSTNADQLKAAYEKIFAEIKTLKENASKADWVTEDPLPVMPPEYIEFIGFYDKNGTLQPTGTPLSGTSSEGGENTASYAYKESSKENTITWDLKQSGYRQSESGGVTTYYYSLTYRVRLKNELERFVEKQIYETNAKTTLTYRLFESVNGQTTLSEERKVDFEIPSVHGFLTDLTFKKTDTYDKALAGAVFTLTHDDENCTICRGDGSKVTSMPTYTATSDADGKVTFTGIPSGHAYLLRETKAPPGFVGDSTAHRVVIAYDEFTWEDGWCGKIINTAGAAFPATGGCGILPYLLAGGTLTATPVIYTIVRRRRRRRDG